MPVTRIRSVPENSYPNMQMTNPQSASISIIFQRNRVPSIAKRANLEAPILLNKGSLTRKSETDCCIKFSPEKLHFSNTVRLELPRE